MALALPSEMAATYQQMPTFIGDLKTAINNQDREYMAVLLAIAATAGTISTATIPFLFNMETTKSVDHRSERKG